MVIALYNMKGGVGKTTSAVNLAWLAARSLGPTLLWDLDPQGSASHYINKKPGKNFSAERMAKADERLLDDIRPTGWADLDILPSNLALRDLDQELDDAGKPKKRIARLLDVFQSNYKVVIVDCPPSISTETQALAKVADMVLSPVPPSALSIASYHEFLQFFGDHGGTQKFKAFFSMADLRRKAQREMVESPRPEHFLQTIIPSTSDAEKAAELHQPVVVSSPASRASVAFKELWSEIVHLNTTL